MLIKKPSDIPSSEITPKETFLNRRKFLVGSTLAGAALLGGSALVQMLSPEESVEAGEKLSGFNKSPFSTNEKLTPYKDVTSYNNFYEFGTDKADPAANAHTLKPRPWTVRVEGHIKKPRTFDLDQLMKLATLEERIYRLRCVEGWSMVIPWLGFPINELIRQVEPTSKAKFVEFVTLKDPAQMPGQRRDVLQWPYKEGLRLDEAMHPLAILSFGLYGEVLPNQNGAPVRLVVPWKYGFKSAKSIVAIRFVESMPRTAWNLSAPHEYGFYSNVNPQVDHPRWSQARERRIGEFLKRPTLMFNGYADQVASLYSGMNLARDF